MILLLLQRGKITRDKIMRDAKIRRNENERKIFFNRESGI